MLIPIIRKKLPRFGSMSIETHSGRENVKSGLLPFLMRSPYANIEALSLLGGLPADDNNVGAMALQRNGDIAASLVFHDGSTYLSPVKPADLPEVMDFIDQNILGQHIKSNEVFPLMVHSSQTESVVDAWEQATHRGTGYAPCGRCTYTRHLLSV